MRRCPTRRCFAECTDGKHVVSSKKHTPPPSTHTSAFVHPLGIASTRALSKTRASRHWQESYGQRTAGHQVVSGDRPEWRGASFAPANVPDVSPLRHKLDSLPLYADRGYDSRNNRRLCTSFGLKDRIFRRRTKTTKTRKRQARRRGEHVFMDRQIQKVVVLVRASTADPSWLPASCPGKPCHPPVFAVCVASELR